MYLVPPRVPRTAMGLACALARPIASAQARIRSVREVRMNRLNALRFSAIAGLGLAHVEVLSDFSGCRTSSAILPGHLRTRLAESCWGALVEPVAFSLHWLGRDSDRIEDTPSSGMSAAGQS
jgi:hypothetical protein